ncbi:MAG: glycosyltransferase family 2 protein [Paludibacteraceae bacterium]|nr:glycosyltransferase family 2 protein [Paludibacteraceae bacterium]
MVSVCVATYNGASFIKEQLISILNQLEECDEVIVSDAGSTDNTCEVVKLIGDKRIKQISCYKKNVRVGESVFAKMDNIRYNFENALRMAKGDIIFLADQDDIWFPDKVKKMIEALQDASLVVHDCEVFDGKETIIPSIMDFMKPSIGKWKTFIKPVFMGCCMAFNKEVLAKALPMPNLHVEHDTFIGLCAYKVGVVKIIKEPLIRYRRHGMNASSCAEGSNNSLWIKLLRRWYMLLAYFCIK